MEFEYLTNEKTLVVNITGELDHYMSDKIRDKIDNEILKRNLSNIIFDFSKLSFMDSSGIGVVIGRYKKISSHGGQVVLIINNPQMARIMKMAGIEKIIRIKNSMVDALKIL